MFVQWWQSKRACSPVSTRKQSWSEITLCGLNCFFPQVSCMFQLCLLAFWKVRQSCWPLDQWRRQWGGGRGGGTVEIVPAHKQLNGHYTANRWHMQAVTKPLSLAPRCSRRENRDHILPSPHVSSSTTSQEQAKGTSACLCRSNGYLGTGHFQVTHDKCKICPEMLLECTEVQWVCFLHHFSELLEKNLKLTEAELWKPGRLSGGLLLLRNCDCRPQTVVCTIWKSGPSRQSKSATFSTKDIWV